MLKKIMYSYGNFSAFFLWSPLGNFEKKSCLNKLKFREASRNQKRSICWKFQLSLIGKAEIPIHYTIWTEVEQALLPPECSIHYLVVLKLGNKELNNESNLILLGMELQVVKSKLDLWWKKIFVKYGRA